MTVIMKKGTCGCLLSPRLARAKRWPQPAGLGGEPRPGPRLISSRRRPRLAGTETDGVLPPRLEVRCEPCVAGARGAAGPASVAVHVCRQAAPTAGARTRRVRVLSLQLECTRGFSFPLPWGAGEQRAAMSPGSFSESRG